MSGTLTVEQSNNSLLLKIPNHDLALLQKWQKEFLPACVSLMLNARPAYVIVYSSDGDYEFDSFDSPKDVTRVPTSVGTFLIAGPTIWGDDEIAALLGDNEFELSNLWFYISSTDSIPDPLKLFRETFWHLNSADDVPVAEAECIGLLADGYWLVWNTPASDVKEQLINFLPQLCARFEINLQNV